MCLLVCAGAWASIRLSLAVETVSCIWISNGIISAFVVTAPRRWKILFFAAGQLVNLSADLAFGNSFPQAGWFTVCTAAEVLVTLLALRHFSQRAQVASRRSLIRMALFGVFLGPLVCATLAAPLARVIEGRPLLDAMRIWFMSDAIGAAATLPLMLFLLTLDDRTVGRWRAHAADIARASFLVVATVAIFWQTRYPLIFMLFPPLVVTLFRFRLAGAVYGSSFVVMVAAAFTAEGHGPFAPSPGAAPAEGVMLFQLFGLIVFASCIPLGFAIEERHLLEGNLKKANRKLADLALLDPLTGVRNRRFFDATLESEWSRACHDGSALSLLFLDIDFFKLFNDTYGHQMGDECLRLVAEILIRSVRYLVDTVTRYGGEEFVILLPATNADSARAIADRILAEILELRVPHVESPFRFITASLGVATVWPPSDGDPKSLLRLADSALYTAKQRGRHRIETTFEPGMVLERRA